MKRVSEAVTDGRIFKDLAFEHNLYKADIAAIAENTIQRHGEQEWRAVLLATELHGHLGIYSILGAKMGVRACELLETSSRITTLSYAGKVPPLSCLNDGLQAGCGSTLGRGLIEVDCRHPRVEARFRYGHHSLRLRLLPQYQFLIKRDIERCTTLYPRATPRYWQQIRHLALGYWQDMSREEIFEMD